MRYAASLMTILVLGILFTGCTQLSGTGPATTGVPSPAIPTLEPATTAPTAAETGTPRQVVTIVHQISQVRDVKDTELLFTLQVPVEWNVTTYRINNPDTYEGLSYQTDLQPGNVFYIQTYAISRNQDQAYRDQFRLWSPAPDETTVTINEITYDRFEGVSGNRTNVAYVARKSSANERGYASMLFYSADNRIRFEKEDFERVIASFQYFPGTFAGRMPGEEIPRVLPPMIASPGINSRSGSGDSGTTGGASGCSRCGV